MCVGLFVLYIRALEVWGSWGKLEMEKRKRRIEMEAMERRRRGLSELITYLKKINKDLSRKTQDQEVWRRRLQIMNRWCKS